MRKHLILVIFIPSILFLSPSLSDPRTSVADILCQLSDGTKHGDSLSNFITVMDFLSHHISQNNHAATHSVKSSSSNVYGLAQCHKDLSHNDCRVCFQEAREKLNGCLPGVAGRVFLDGCFVRYDGYDFYNESVSRIYNSTKCGAPTKILNDKYMQKEFARKLRYAIRNVTEMSLVKGKHQGFGAAEVKSGLVMANALGQCWEGLDNISCWNCLWDAGQKVRKCVPGAEGRALNAGCYLRYSTREFFHEDATQREDVESGLPKAAMIILVFSLSLVFLLLSLLGAFVGYKRYSRRKEERKKVGRIPSAVNKSCLHFKYEMLEHATNSFNSSNKLGQGGSGSVFKGTLPDGKTIAVKRLFFNTRQWVDEFFNEVNLISGIQHKNLVRLLGCSIEGPESLLVYEFIPNRSLNEILFDKNKAQTLSWQQRFNIILGIAEGLAYLHEGCHEKIIHRDIKNSNILLDGDLTPKIADFGLARCVAANRTHISTAIAGTLGYMAPEYLVRGQLSEKTDVYAFGVLALEIACGKKNNVFVHDSGSVLQSVWKHYKSKNITQSIDNMLKGDFQENEASKILQIGLMCTQTSSTLRPSMSKVVHMLTDKKAELPSPKQPPFLNSSVLASQDSAKSSGMNNSFSSLHTTTDMPSTNSSISAFRGNSKSNASIDNV